ncbi:ankyrin repeat-containing domain protein [Nemania sp. FL0916]|nr:ankyrin repeat-containing domain protein [Nemania sp. FL0916]
MAMISYSGSGSQNFVSGNGHQNIQNGSGIQNNYYAFPPQNAQASRVRDEERLQKEKQDCLRSLSYPHMNTRRDNIDDAHPNTCEWLSSTIEFEKWRDIRELPTHNGILWIKGKPGSGKSTVMKHLLSFCEASFGTHRVISYFFNARGGVLEKTPLGMMRSIVYQLVSKSDTIYHAFIEVYREKRAEYYRKNTQQQHYGIQWQQPELKGFIQSIAKQQQPEPLLLLVDALDECADTEVRDVVSFLETISSTAVESGTELRICLSSRHYPEIGMKRQLTLVMESTNEHQKDIARYVLENLCVPDHSIVSQVQRTAGGVFLWAVLVVTTLNSAYNEGQGGSMQERLDQTPKDLEGIFDMLLERKGPEKTELVRMLQWVLLSKRSLTPQELWIASVREPVLSLDPEIIRRRIVRSSGGLIKVRKHKKGEYVQFVHLSVNDLLYRCGRLEVLDPTLQPDAISATHALLWAFCWVSIEGYGNIISLSSYERDLLYETGFFFSYASNHILHHANMALSGCTTRTANGDITLWLNAVHDWIDSVNYPRLLNGYTYRAYYSSGSRLLVRGSSHEKLLITCLAADYRHLFNFVLENYVGIDAVLSNHSTLLQLASSFFDSFTVAQFLLEKGADVNARGGRYGNALQAACSHDQEHIQLVTLLIENSANVNSQGGFYGNALQAACTGERIEKLETVKLLVENGADVNAQGGFYGNALQAACTGDKFEKLEIVKLLLENKANIHARGGEYGGPLCAACSFGNIKIARLLIRKGANIHAQGGHHGNVLGAARKAPKNSEKLVKLLIDRDAEDLPGSISEDDVIFNGRHR